MAITVSQLCVNAEKMYHMKLCAGAAGLENIVRWVHMVEDCAVPDFLHGNELVFTTGIGHYGTDWLTGFAESLHEHNAAGLVVNIGPHIDSIPTKTIVYCEQNALPLFAIPWNVHIIDITYNFCRRIIANEKTETSLAEAFRNLVFTPENRRGYAAALERSGFREDSRYMVIAISLLENDVEAANKIYSGGYLKLWQLLKKSSSPVGIFTENDTLILIRQNVSDDELVQLFSDLRTCIETEYSDEIKRAITFGVSDSGGGILSIVDGYKQAISALKTAKIHNKENVFYRDIGVYKLIFGVDNKCVLSDFVSGTLGRLIDYDEKNNTDYTMILKSYLDCGGSVQELATRSGVHRNTVNYKMKVIREILNVELNDREKTDFRMAYYVSDILSQ